MADGPASYLVCLVPVEVLLILDVGHITVSRVNDHCRNRDIM